MAWIVCSSFVLWSRLAVAASWAMSSSSVEVTRHIRPIRLRSRSLPRWQAVLPVYDPAHARAGITGRRRAAYSQLNSAGRPLNPAVFAASEHFKNTVDGSLGRTMADPGGEDIV